MLRNLITWNSILDTLFCSVLPIVRIDKHYLTRRSKYFAPYFKPTFLKSLILILAAGVAHYKSTFLIKLLML